MSAAGAQAARRATKNTAARAVGEIAGKLASLAMFAVLARKTGAAGFGYYVFALAWAEVAMTPVGLGIDRFALRLIAADRGRLGELLYNVLLLKLLRGALILVAAIGLAAAIGYDGTRLATVAVLTAGMFLDTLARTYMSVFNAFERGDLVAATIMAQRIGAAALALAALFAGLGVAAVAVAFAIGAAIRLVLSHLLLRRRIARPPLQFPAEPRLELRRRSLPYIGQDLFGLVLARGDIVLLQMLASDAVVGAYGAAYRLLDTTAFVTTALSGAFSAMYTYLGPDTVPTLRAVFQRSLKAALVLLVPVAVGFEVLAEPLVRAFYGAKLEAAADPLRLLAPVVVVYSLYVLAGALIVSRHEAWKLLRIIGVTAAANLGLNLALIPPLGAVGAATAMLASALLYAALALRFAAAQAGGLDLGWLVAGPAAGGLAMAVPMLLLGWSLPLAAAAGTATFLGVTALVERAVDPGDFAFVADLARRALPWRRSRVPA